MRIALLALLALARCAGRIVHPRVANLTRDFDLCVSDLKLNRQLVPLVLRADMSLADAVAAVCRPRGPGDPADAALITAWIEHKVSQALYTRAEVRDLLREHMAPSAERRSLHVTSQSCETAGTIDRVGDWVHVDASVLNAWRASDWAFLLGPPGDPEGVQLATVHSPVPPPRPRATRR